MRAAALGDAGRGNLGDDVVDGRRRRIRRRRCRSRRRRCGTGRAPARALFAGLELDEVGFRDQHAIALEHVALVREIQTRQRDSFRDDVLPDVQLGPVREREHAKVFAGKLAAVVEIPQLGTLVLRVPLSEHVTMREDALLGPRLFFVAARSADRGVEAAVPRIASSRVTVCSALRLARGPLSSIDATADRSSPAP